MDDLHQQKNNETGEFTELKLFVEEDLYRAFQRCVWILVNETGRDQLDIMQEAVRDFLVKHGC